MRNLLGGIICATATLVGAEKGDVRLSDLPLGKKADDRLFSASVRSFQSGHWATSARWFQELIDRHGNSPHRPVAVLLLGQSLFQQGQHREAYAVLSNDRLAAGPLADEYLFWMAEGRTAQGNLEAALQIYEELLREHPQSKRALDAALGVANVSARQEDWAQVIARLRPLDGVFQVHAKTIPADDRITEGRLLLGQAYFEQRDFAGAMAALAQLPKQLDLQRNWRRQWLLARIASQKDETDKALLIGDVLRTIAEQQAWPEQLVRAYQLRAELYEQQGKWNQAAQEYAHLIGGKQPSAIRRPAFLQVARLHIRQRAFPKALATLKHLRLQKGLADIHPLAAYLTGEVHLLQAQQGKPGELALAISEFETLAWDEAQSPFQTQALCGLAQCRRLEGQSTVAAELLQKALEGETEKSRRSWVQYQLSLVQAREGRHAVAAAGFQNVRTNSVEGITSQMIHAARFMQFKSVLAQTNLGLAEALLAEGRAQAGASHFDRMLLSMAQARVSRNELEEARGHLVEFRQQATGSSLQAAAALEAIHLLVTERKWTEVIASYDDWIKTYPEHPELAKVVFDRAWALAQSGQVKLAMGEFDRLSKQPSQGARVFKAKMWLADQAFNSVTNRLNAEKWYKEIRGATNCPPVLRHRARMMAGRAAMARQGLNDARTEFSALMVDASVKADYPRIFQEATFAMGDLTMLELGSEAEDQIKKLSQATNAFYSLVQIAPTNALAARAWGRIGDCCLKISGDVPGYRDFAEAAYRNALAVTGPVSANVRSQIHFGLAQTLERRGAAGEARQEALQLAVNELLKVFYGDLLADRLDPYWRGQSGLMAMRLLEELGKHDEALKICAEMEKDFPGMRPGLRLRRARLEKLQSGQP